jgi:metal-dependent amidase/aminoacylase/carboxypeptidase family protein
VLGAGQRLTGEGGFGGAVHLVFQPAEEHGLSQPRGRLATPGGRNR